ncbi:DUF3147 family protein [Vibrio sp. SCSIO 43136]|uniref:DUF3147 family protein n=1 Tax=Vibrio sp. SCSIO 43136 TaxID=2819101 RepID=UPI0020756DA8|nr:DUF3147 family protein [Vibrio sp. SCSIO 43136]USD66904.1 DUF3147 family protein [Vibrio sp. SCSIO 43136]
MAWLIAKYAITAGLVVLISEIAKRSDKLGALTAALPTVTILALIWMHLEGLEQGKLSKHAYYTFWYVLPTLPMFLAFPWLLKYLSFWTALAIGAMISIGCFAILTWVLKSFGINLL